MGVSENGGTPKSSNLIGISIINHPFWGTPIFGNPHMVHEFGKYHSPSLLTSPADGPLPSVGVSPVGGNTNEVEMDFQWHALL